MSRGTSILWWQAAALFLWVASCHFEQLLARSFVEPRLENIHCYNPSPNEEQNGTLVCIISPSQSEDNRPPWRPISTTDRQWRPPRLLRLQCNGTSHQEFLESADRGTSSLNRRIVPNGENGDGGERRGHQPSAPHSSSAPLRDILDQVLSSIEDTFETDSSSSLWQSLRELQVINCLEELQRLDLLFLASSFTYELTSLRIQDEFSEQRKTDKFIIREPDVFTDGPRKLSHLDLSSVGLQFLPEGALCPLQHSLHSLNLTSNLISDVADLGLHRRNGGVACQISKVHSINLSRNRLQVIKSGALEPVLASGSLRDLDLSGNEITRLEDHSLASASQSSSQLQVLNLAHNRLSQLPDNLLVSRLEQHADSAQVGLTELYLSNNTLSQLPRGLLDRLTHLVVLNLSHNALTNRWLQESPFQALKSLVALDLSHNRLQGIEARFFQGLNSLQVLTVAHNQIHSVSGQLGKVMPTIHALVLAHNNIEELPSDVFDGLNQLSSLGLDHNGIKTLARDAFNACCSNLQDLALHSNSFRHIPHPALKPLAANLRTLDLGENQISVVHPNALAGFDELYGLRLAGNQIQSLPEKVFAQADNIKMLNLADNRIQNIEQDVFLPLKSLKALRLDNNELEDFNGLLTTQHQLQWLNISNNRLLWFDYAFIPKSLLWLNLAGNQIEELENYYEMQIGFHLVHLDVSHNLLKKMDRQSLVPSLKELKFQSNLIEEFAPNTLIGLSNLTSVNLSNNRLSKFSLNSLALTREQAENTDQVELFLAGNPIVCDCEMEWLQRINDLAQRAPREFAFIADWENISCALNNRPFLSPGLPSNETKLILPLKDVQPSEFICQYQTHCFALCMCCDFFACDCRMKCSDGCECFNDQTWSANIIQCGKREHREVPEFIPMDATAIYLDGNNHTDLSTETFIGRKHLTSLFLNNSAITMISNKTFGGLSELLILHLEHNKLSELTGGELLDLSSLRELYLDHNSLTHIHPSAFKNLQKLQILTLNHNKLVAFPLWELFQAGNVHQVALASNPWSCECGFLQNVQKFLKEHQERILDAQDLTCVVGDSSQSSIISNASCADVLAVSFRDQNGDDRTDQSMLVSLVPVVAVVSSAFIIVISLIILAVALRKPISIWFRSKYGIHLMERSNRRSMSGSDDTNTSGGGVGGGNGTVGGIPIGHNQAQYDVYVHYNADDGLFVQQNLSPALPTRSFLHHRDLRSKSRSLGDAIEATLDASASVLVLASRDYLNNEVCRNEFGLILDRMAVKIRLRHLIVVTVNAEDQMQIRNVVPRDCHQLSVNDDSFRSKLRQIVTKNRETALITPLRVMNGVGKHQQHQDYVAADDDMWTYLKGVNSASSSTTGGQDSSVSTRSTDNSNTLPSSNSMNQPGSKRLSTLQPHKSNLIVNPMDMQNRSMTSQKLGHLPGSRSKGRIVENPLELSLHSDSDYMSVSDSLPKQQEPIYHTLEPPFIETVLPKKLDRVYINADLEVVYPRVSRPRQQHNLDDFIEDFVDEDDELLADELGTENDSMYEDERQFSRNNSYVPSPAPGSMPRNRLASNTGSFSPHSSISASQTSANNPMFPPNKTSTNSRNHHRTPRFNQKKSSHLQGGASLQQEQHQPQNPGYYI